MTTTAIEWAEQVWNPLVGCTVHSPGCTNCYAMRMAYRLTAMAEAGNTGLDHYRGTTRMVNGNPVWTGQVNLAPETTLLAPLRRKKPTRYFVNSMSDLFHADVPDEAIDRIFAVMALCPQHTFQVLTKRSDRMREYVSSLDQAVVRAFTPPHQHPTFDDPHAEFFAIIAPKPVAEWRLPNVWLGVSVEDQARADQRIPDLLATPAAVRWISAEPLLGPVDLSNLMFVETECQNWEMEGSAPPVDPETGAQECCSSCDWTGIVSVPKLDWIVCGGESGPNARPMHPDWPRSLRDQCATAGVPFFFKQWGEWEARQLVGPDPSLTNAQPCGQEGHWRFNKAGKKAAGRLLDGQEWSQVPDA